MNCTKGKKNKFKIGQKVKATPKVVDWFSSHFAWSYGRQTKKEDGYREGETEIGREDLHKVYLWSRAQLSGKLPIGTIVGYGAVDNDDRIDRKNVLVVFEVKTDIGIVRDETYIEEKNLWPIKKKR